MICEGGHKAPRTSALDTLPSGVGAGATPGHTQPHTAATGVEQEVVPRAEVCPTDLPVSPSTGLGEGNVCFYAALSELLSLRSFWSVHNRWCDIMTYKKYIVGHSGDQNLSLTYIWFSWLAAPGTLELPQCGEPSGCPRLCEGGGFGGS